MKQFITVLTMMLAASYVVCAQQVSPLLDVEEITFDDVEDRDVADTSKDPVQQWVDLGNAELQAGRYEKSIRSFSLAVAQDPANKEARFGMGTAYIQLERYKEALDLLAPMTDEFPDDYFLKNNVAWLYATAKDHSVRNGAKAIAIAQDALMIAPRDYHVWSTLAEAYYVSGQYEKALRTAEEALRLGQEVNAVAVNIREYQYQITKCRKAVQAMSLLE